MYLYVKMTEIETCEMLFLPRREKPKDYEFRLAWIEKEVS